MSEFAEFSDACVALTRRLGIPVPAGILEWILGAQGLGALWEDAQTRAEPNAYSRILKALDVDYECADADLARIPREGALLVISNHPLGMLDGVVLGAAISRVRPDVRFVANSLLSSVSGLRDRILPVDPFGGNGCVQRNSRSLRASIKFLRQGGALVVFPAGEVSGLRGLPPAISDSSWNENLLRIAEISKARIVPAFVFGRNSALFQMAGAVHPSLRVLLLGRELLKKRGTTVKIAFANPVPQCKVHECSTSGTLAEYLRERTYLLGQRRTRASETRCERKVLAVAPPIAMERLERDVAALPPEARLFSSGKFSIYLAAFAALPNAIGEIGRLREITFRAAGEGTGKACDLDRFDVSYQHLFLWNSEAREVVGAYRVACVDEQPANGLYTQTLFRLGGSFRSKMRDGVELGRSFIRAEYQRSPEALHYLWKGICTFLYRNPRYRYVFGPVSISDDYCLPVRELIVTYFRSRCGTGREVSARRPFRVRQSASRPLQQMMEGVRDLRDVSSLAADLDDRGRGVPVLLRHYAALGGVILDFNLDPLFSNALDGLVVVDVPCMGRPMLDRLMGRREAAAYLQYHSPALMTA